MALNMSIDVTILMAWTEMRGNNSKRSPEKHAHDLHFALVTKVLLWLLHSATTEPRGSCFTVISLYTDMFCNHTAGVSNQWKDSFPGFSIAAGLPSNRDFYSLHISKITPPFVGFCNSWDLSQSPAFSSFVHAK